MIKSSALPPEPEVFNGKVVIAVDDLIVIIEIIVGNVASRFVYDWLKKLFKGGN